MRSVTFESLVWGPGVSVGFILVLVHTYPKCFCLTSYAGSIREYCSENQTAGKDLTLMEKTAGSS